MTNLENIDQFLLEANIETINNFIGEPLAINIDKNVNEVNDDVLDFINRLASKIRQLDKPKPLLERLFERYINQ